MTKLSSWLQSELQKRQLTQNQAAVYAGVGQATVSDILNRGHIPRVETLFRLADFFGTPREEALRAAGYLPPAPRVIGAEEDPDGEDQEAGRDEALIHALLREFRQVPDEWKPVAVLQVAQLRQLDALRPVRVIGEEEAEPGEREPGERVEERDEGATKSEAA